MEVEVLNVEQFGAALSLWILVALIIEELAKALFDWKLYKDNLGGKGFKTPILFVISALICFIFGIDIFLALVEPLGIKAETNWPQLRNYRTSSDWWKWYSLSAPEPASRG